MHATSAAAHILACPAAHTSAHAPPTPHGRALARGAAGLQFSARVSVTGEFDLLMFIV